MKKYTWPFLILATLANVSPADAGFEEPPAIVVTTAERRVNVILEADESSYCDQRPAVVDPMDCGRTPYNGIGPFNEEVSGGPIVGKEGSSSSGQAKQDTDISIFSIRGSGSVTAGASLGFGEKAQVNAASDSRIFVIFTVPEGAPYTLSGTLKADGEGGGFCLSGATVSLSLIHNHSVNCNTAPEDESFFFVGVALDSEMAIAVEVNAFPSGDESFDFTGEGAASFEFTLDFGDRDGDGLLDDWEENGIDFQGAGIEIDLPAMGTNPDKKDLFVEVDVMAGVAFDQQAIDDVILAFAQAPASMVDNPDGSAGINLHVLTDGDRPPREPLIGPGGALPSAFYAIKDSFFGSEDDRGHPAWDVIRRAKLLIYRYCLWADTLEDPLGDLLGLAEGIPSNDFIVAAGRTMTIFSDVPTAGLSAIFMHEFGHTLGLHHGGQDGKNTKPNYLSLMNYTYLSPSRNITTQGTNSADYWRLDYSRSGWDDLDETSLNENQALGGPAGRVVIFNSANAGDPTPVKRAIAWANDPTPDWNQNGGLPKADPYQLDISRINSGSLLSYDSLKSYSDWSRIWYHLSGTVDFDDRQKRHFATPSPPVELDLLLSFLDVEWVDTTVLGDLVFENGFELGSTTAWSETVP